MPAIPEAIGIAVCAALRAQAARAGVDIGPEPVWAEAQFSTVTDPFSQAQSRVATWQGRARYGKATFFPDGRVFAEYQVLLPHPENPEIYIEAVQVWGRPPAFKGEAVVAAGLK